METRYNNVVGPTGAGKSTVIEILKKVENVFIYYMNAKSITTNELYGNGCLNKRMERWIAF